MTLSKFMHTLRRANRNAVAVYHGCLLMAFIDSLIAIENRKKEPSPTTKQRSPPDIDSMIARAFASTIAQAVMSDAAGKERTPKTTLN